MDALQAQRSPLGYIMSGRFDADLAFEDYERWHRQARTCLRWGLIGEGKYAIRQAKRAFRRYRYFRERIRT